MNNNLSAMPQAVSAVDSGFHPDDNGFSFENYGDEIPNTGLTPTEMQRMFGDGVIASRAGGNFVLTPPAERWMNMANEAMAYGHCEGMSVLSVLMYYNQISPIEFEGNAAIDLSIRKEMLQREIAYWWATQATSPGGSIKVRDSPNAVLDILTKAFEEGQNTTEWWVLGIFKPDGSGGHSITPIAVEDMGNGTAKILVYDNNFPKNIRAIEINKTANTWKYYASVNPDEPSSLYMGNSSTRSLLVASISSRLDPQRCDFCDEGQSTNTSGPGSKGPLAGIKQTQVWLSGNSHLLITDQDGLRIGFLESGQFINEIPGADVRNLTFVSTMNIRHEPIYSIPAYVNYEIELDGSGLEEPGRQSLWVFGPGSVIGLQNILLNPGEHDYLSMVWQGKDDLKLTYTTTSKEKTVDLTICLKADKELGDAYYEFTIKGAKVDDNGQLILELDMGEGKLTFATSNNEDPGKLQVQMRRVDSEGEHIFSNSETSLQNNDVVHLDFGHYDEENGTMPAEIAHENGIIETIILNDETTTGLESDTDFTQEQTGTPEGSHICVNGFCDITITVNVD